MNPAELIFSHFPDLTDVQKQQFNQLSELYATWNEQINVISRKDMEQFYERHVLHSLAIAKVMAFKPGTAILDIGTGGGFPGIPLAILFPECKFHLCDSIGKKIKVVQGVATALGLTNITATHERAENVPGTFDFVVSRAVTAMPVFLTWLSKKFNKDQFNDLPNGILYLKGGDLTEEMATVKQTVTYYNIPDFYPEEFFETKKVVHVKMKSRDRN
jgi:16S rRNA (guanine527-N7)-methyltransferase